jgi:hypothetical protein
MMVGIWITLPWTASIWSSFRIASEPPKSTVPRVNWRIPPPEPIGW